MCNDVSSNEHALSALHRTLGSDPPILLALPEDAQMHDGATPLLAAALQGHVEVVWGAPKNGPEQLPVDCKWLIQMMGVSLLPPLSIDSCQFGPLLPIIKTGLGWRQ